MDNKNRDINSASGRRVAVSGWSLDKVLAVVLFLICAAIGFLFSSCHGKKSEAAPAEPEIEVAAPVERDSVVIYNSYPAILESESEADVVARVNGQLLRQHFENGAYVKKGQPLFTIESTIYAATAAEAKAQVASASGQLDYARKHLAALEQALKANAVSEMEVIQARSAEAAALAQLNEARATLTTANTRLGYCTVVAPISGRISAPLLDVGSYLNGEGAPVKLATIYDESDLAAVFSITDSEYASITGHGKGFADPVYRDIPVYITASEDVTDDAPLYKADVSYEAPSVQPTSGNIQLKAMIKIGKGDLRPGMYGRVMLPVGKQDNALLIDDASISTDQRGRYVYVVNDSDKVVYTPIEVGALYDDTLRLVKKGLLPTDRYVTRAMISVRNGEKVKPVSADRVTSGRAPDAPRKDK